MSKHVSRRIPAFLAVLTILTFHPSPLLKSLHIDDGEGGVILRGSGSLAANGCECRHGHLLGLGKFPMNIRSVPPKR